MNDQSPDLPGEAAEPLFARPPRGRHATPRTSALTRLRVPVGKALALTALPTALILGSQRLPASADTSATAAQSAPAAASGGPEAAGVDCGRPGDTSARATPTPTSPPPSVAPTPSADPSASSAHPSGESAQPSERTDDKGAASTPARTATPTPSPSATSPTIGLGDILGLLNPLHEDVASQSPAPDVSPPPNAATATPKVTASAEPRLPTASSEPLLPTTSASPAPSHRTAGPSPAPESAREAARTCDISDLKAPEDTGVGRFPDEAWNMKGSRLALHDVVFHGVVTVDTAAGPKRVLKFTAAAVTIRDLKMAVPVGPQIQHIDGGPGSTSTLQGGDITMYVESLTGTLAGVENIPTPPALRLHLTPDTVPEWLYDTIGHLGLKLQLSLDDADIDQAGQAGGKLAIPGIHGYGTPR
ncbi:hypothetical protein [Streptomyces mirabilis]|uniref:hypothetical protein n=1 Tax=Streptomyces mirabilis TaxID=68239 RepID=UPI0033E5E957